MSDSKPRDKEGKFVSGAEKAAADARPNQVIVGEPGANGEGTYGAPVGANVPTEERMQRGMAEQYPTDALSAADGRDELMMMRYNLGERLGRQQFKDEDAYWLLKKMEAAKDADFQSWFAREYDRMDDVHKKWARKAFPRFFQQRLATLDKNAEMLKRLARIRITGVTSKQDLALKYAADRGLIPVEIFENLLHPEQAHQARAVNEQSQFRRGLFNIDTSYMNERSPNDNYSAQQRANAYHGGRVPRPNSYDAWAMSGNGRPAATQMGVETQAVAQGFLQ